MKKLCWLTFVLLVLTVVVAKNGVAVSPGLLEDPGLFKIPFRHRIVNHISEGPDGSVIMTFMGDKHSPGKLIRFDPVTKEFRELIEFKDEAGSIPCIRTVNDLKENIIYGTTSDGGKDDCGLLYSLNVTTGERKTLFHFADHHLFAPRYGLQRYDDHTLMGVASVADSARVFTYDLRNGEIKKYKVDRRRKEYILCYPVVRADKSIVVLTSCFSGVTFNEFDLSKNVITDTTVFAGHFEDRIDLVLANDGCIYGSNEFVYDPENSGLALIKFNPEANTVERLMLPPQNSDNWGPRLSLDRSGNVLGAFWLGGTQNLGSIIRYNTVSHKMEIVKDWQAFEAGCMPYNGVVLHHSNGKMYGFSLSGGRNERPSFYSFDPVSGLSERHAYFIFD